LKRDVVKDESVQDDIERIVGKVESSRVADASLVRLA
jgi:hypothetical protein